MASQIDIGLIGIKALDAEMRDRLADKQRTIDRLATEVVSEREARQKSESALRGKDQAMGVLFKRLQDAGVDCSDLLS